MLETTVLGGVVLGLASALHCGAMCGGIACGALGLLGAPTQAERYRQLALMQMGRVATYTAIGAAGALIGSALAAPGSGVSFQVMQWAAAVSLMWMGLVLAGAMPRFALLDRGMNRVSSAIGCLAAPLRARPNGGPLVLGVAWGLNACPMVYGAAFFASLTGSVAKGATFMAGFGLGTVPAVVAAAAGISFLRKLNATPRVRVAAGLTIALLGFASVYLPPQLMPLFCLTR